MENGKKKKVKPYKSALSNALWSFGEMLKSAPAAFWLTLAIIPFEVFLAWTEIELPALVVREVTGGQSFKHAAIYVGILISAAFIVKSLDDYFRVILQAYTSRYRYTQCIRLEKKAMSCYYQIHEKKQTRDMYDRAMVATWMNRGKVRLLEVPEKSAELLKNVLCYALFGTVISFVSPWLVLFLTVAPLINWFCIRAYQKYEYKTRAERADIDRKKDYVTSRAANFSAAKDIRVYGMSQWLKSIFKDVFDKSMAWQKRLNFKHFLSQLPDLFVILLRDGAAYAVLIAMALRGEISVDEFVLYFGAISSFATYVGGIMTSWIEMHEASLVVSDFREYLDLPDGDDSGTELASACSEYAPTITFEHVSFKYDGAEKNTLDDISFTMKSGERIALVGMNGAGKTTLVKLLCGLYRPTSGEIKIDGIPARNFAREEYYKLFSPVFQNVRTAFLSLAETVSGTSEEKTDKTYALECMKKAGLEKKIESLSHGIDTRLDKQVNDGGIELSGGEAQKLMMARALYKNAPILVLDEPTSALDPIAENEIYLKYRDMTEGKTSLFISHRLASTKFCDRILLLEGGKIAEEGTHDELIAKGGEYAKLFEIQSCWYREDYKGGERK